MLIFHLLISSLSVDLDDENVNTYLNQKSELPSFIKIYSVWCKFCRAFNKDWNHVITAEQFASKINFLELDCDANIKLCDTFPGNGLPRLFYYDPKTNETFKYLGERNASNIIDFLQQQLDYPLKTINNIEQINEYIIKSANITTFLFEIPKQYEELVKNVISSFNRNFFSYFLKIESQNSLLTAYYGANRTVYFEKIWNLSNLDNFIKLYSIPYCMEFSGAVLRYSANLSIPVMVLLTNEDTGKYDSIKYSLSKRIPVTIGNCNRSNWLCEYTMFNIKRVHTEFLYLNWSAQSFWLYKGKKHLDKLEEWINDIESHKIKPQGPGTGSFSGLYSSYYDIRRNGYIAVFFFVFVPLFASITFILAIIYTIKTGVYEMGKDGKPKED